jgi:hypothetical protein
MEGDNGCNKPMIWAYGYGIKCDFTILKKTHSIVDIKSLQ